MKLVMPPRDDRGSTLLVAMMVMGVAMSLSLLIVTVAMGTSRTTGDDRERLVAVNGAEAAVDAGYVSIQSNGSLLPCTWPNFGVKQIQTSPDKTLSSAAIRYFRADGTELTCMGGLLPPSSIPADAPVQAEITGTGTAGNAEPEQRKMQALVNLTPVLGDGLDKALFGNSGVSLENNATVTGTAGQTADVYSNGDFYCDSSPTFQGSILAPTGKITMKNTCQATGDVWARDAVVLEGGKTIGGRVLSSSSSITAASNTAVNGTLMASGAISWAGCSLPGKCLSGQSAVPSPPISTFPQLKGDSASLATWMSAPPTGAGYSHVAVPAGTCGKDAGGWLADKMKTLTTGTIFTTDCHVEFRNTKDTPIGADVMIFARGGISTSNQVSLRSTGGARNVYFIQPYDAVPYMPCTSYPTSSPVMGPTQQFSSTSDIGLLWYSPCDISYGNQGGSYGQVLSGSRLTTNNQYTLTFRKLPMYGVPTTTSTTTKSYKVDIVYKRETN